LIGNGISVEDQLRSSTENIAMEDHRNLTRIKIAYYLRVFDEATDAMLGHVADITAQGMMVISERPIPVDTVFKLWMEVPSDDQHRERVYIEALAVWSRQDANPDFYDAGFRLIEPSREAIRKINELIDQFTL